MELVHVLDRSLHLDAVRLTLEIDRLVERFLLLIQLPDKSDDALRLVVHNMLRRLQPLVVKDDRQLRIQIRSLMETALHLVRPETGLLKDRVIGQEVHRRACLPRLPDLREQSVLQLDDRDPSLVPVMVDVAVPADLHIHIRRERVHD